MPESKNGNRDIAVNRRAFHDYFIDEKYEAGMVLTGTEVKSLRAGKVNLRDGFVRVDGNAAWLENVKISPYAKGNIANHEPLQARKLLMHIGKIASMNGKISTRGLLNNLYRMYFTSLLY